MRYCVASIIPTKRGRKKRKSGKWGLCPPRRNEKAIVGERGHYL